MLEFRFKVLGFRVFSISGSFATNARVKRLNARLCLWLSPEPESSPIQTLNPKPLNPQEQDK